MKKSSRPAFVLADSIVALTIVSLSVAFTLMSHQCLHQQLRRQETELAASRLGKESADELLVSHHRVHKRRGNLVAEASLDRIIVYSSGQRIVEVTR